jgi:hypothetical protein
MYYYYFAKFETNFAFHCTADRSQARAYELMRADATTVILLYTDAPPHTFANGQMGEEYSQLEPELKALSLDTSYSSFGPKFADWVSGAKILRRGEKKAQVFSILDARDMGFPEAGYYNYLSTMTHGACVYLQDSKPGIISKVTIDVLLAWMGAEKPGAANAEYPAYLSRYVSGEHIKKVNHEEDPVSPQLVRVSLCYLDRADINCQLTGCKLILRHDLFQERPPREKH